MREIKFRQAILFNDKFHHWHYWGFIDGAFVGPETGISSMSDALKNSQMFTILLDKKGVEIYEGDIVKEYRVPLGCGSQEKWDELSKEVRRTSPVLWDDDELTFSIDGTRIGVLNGWSNLEAIGNIYENPELLEAGNGS